MICSGRPFEHGPQQEQASELRYRLTRQSGDFGDIVYRPAAPGAAHTHDAMVALKAASEPSMVASGTL